ncbi:MAG: VWA domain-containing protein [bacterium]
MMRFANPLFLLILVILPLLILYKHRRSSKPAALTFSDLGIVKEISPPRRVTYQALLTVLRVIALSFIILALARPQTGVKGEEIIKKGIDIILCLDTSRSMLAEDFKPKNRFEAARTAAVEFIKGRKSDRIGVVSFAGLSLTQAPLTLDYGALFEFLDKVEVGMTGSEGTAIGIGIMTSLSRLKESQAKSKVIILLTDGRNNTGEIDPLTAARAAASFGVKIYTIGAGSKGKAPYPINHPIFGKKYIWIDEDLDEETLSQIAKETGGLYFRATSSEGLSEIYKQIDKLEKTEIKVKEYMEYREIFPYFLGPGLAFILLEIGLAQTVLRKIP